MDGSDDSDALKTTTNDDNLNGDHDSAPKRGSLKEEPRRRLKEKV